MTRYLSSLLCLLSTAACSHNPPAQAPEESARYEAASTTTTTTGAPESAPITDTRLPPVSTEQPSSSGTAATTNGSKSSSSDSGDTGAASTSTDYKTMNANVAPDNTRVNKRDTKSSALTPLDQGEGKTDLDITQRIRQAVVGDHSLSFSAKNVKIITQNGKVTLRGPVDSNAERSAVQAAAEKVAGAGNVSNQLEVKK